MHVCAGPHLWSNIARPFGRAPLPSRALACPLTAMTAGKRRPINMQCTLKALPLHRARLLEPASTRPTYSGLLRCLVSVDFGEESVWEVKQTPRFLELTQGQFLASGPAGVARLIDLVFVLAKPRTFTMRFPVPLKYYEDKVGEYSTVVYIMKYESPGPDDRPPRSGVEHSGLLS